jgi:hypothetical protein
MRIPDPLLTFAELVERICVAYPDFAYIHVLGPTIYATTDPTGKEKREI